MMKIKRKNGVKNITIDLINMTKNYVVYAGDDELMKGKVYLHKENFIGELLRSMATVTITIGKDEKTNGVKNITIDLINMTKNYVVYSGDDGLMKGKIYLHKENFIDGRIPTTITITIGKEEETV
jgi:hypothetical protein